MIFLSHNSNDKPVVEQVALKLKNIYGQDKVFYDSWSIQPGEGIVDKMDEGLTNCRYFFFFVSVHSYQNGQLPNARFINSVSVYRFVLSWIRCCRETNC